MRHRIHAAALACAAGFALAGCTINVSAGAPASPTPTRAAVATLADTCQALFGADLNGPVPESTNILTQLALHPDLSTITNADLTSTIHALAAAKSAADPSLRSDIGGVTQPLQELLEVKSTGKNITVDTGAWKIAQLRLLGDCGRYLPQGAGSQ